MSRSRLRARPLAAETRRTPVNPRSSRLVAFLVSVSSFAAIPSARAAVSACDPVFAAMEKLAATPHRTRSIDQLAGRKVPVSGETVTTRDTVYARAGGPWRSHPYDPGQEVKDLQQARGATQGNCTRVRSESVDGEAATLYAIHHEVEDATSDQQLWISDASGLPLRQVVDIAEGPSHYDVHYDYRDIQPPVDARP
jgi:hypothetical protein